ncbi:Hypothetical protein SRAE_X000083800 [Strongyloides ratti]|uniref:Uncharacterized protein n=1 Tax=Strongyloides ratti TaxID=34506 RepID=A0A090LV26_STRRB|nr:Hypothetical protein SRAE_X000083800 [Strongyloides ratti]CEF71514.1 Hypothetical protein SRAE_X000083800 [Strongyloides ratti]
MACRAYMEVLSCAKRTDNFSNILDNHSIIIAKTEDDIDVSKITSSKYFSDGIISLGLKKTILLEIFPEVAVITRSIMESFGQKITFFLSNEKSYHVLSLRFTIDQHSEYLINYLMREIRCDNIYTLDLRNLSRPYGNRSKNIFFITNDRIFKRFKNLKTIVIHPKNFLMNSILRKFVDVASKIKGITIEIDFEKPEILNHAVNTTLPEGNCIVSYILKKKVFLKIKGIYLKIFSLNNNLLPHHTNFELSFIKTLRLDVSSVSTFRKLCNFLPHMINLEWIGLNFVIKMFPMQVEIKILEKVEETRKFYYQSLENLTNLDTIQITFDFVTNFSHDLLDNIINGVKDITPGNLAHYSETEMERFKMCRLFCQNEMMRFFSVCPKNVHHLYLSKFLQFDTSISTLLNEYFPDLKLLFLERIGDVEKNALMPLKNLRFFIPTYIQEFELPPSVEICMMCYVNDNKNKDVVTEKYENLRKYYTNLSRFTKELVFKDSFSATIVYNYFHSIHVIKNYFDDITEMLDCNDQKQYYKSS